MNKNDLKRKNAREYSSKLPKKKSAINGGNSIPSEQHLSTQCMQECISEIYRSEKFLSDAYCVFQKKSESISNFNYDVMNSPFNVAFLPDFFSDINFVKKLSNDLNSISFTDKSNDLYKFKLSEDLQCINSESIQKLCQIFQTSVKELVEKITGIKLNNKMSITCSKYDYSDILLCHDDNINNEDSVEDGRRVAFVFYLVPRKWKEDDGGSLDLFGVDTQLRPSTIMKRICPKFNSFTFFETSSVSYHQVAEVLAQNKTRLSINGWFHGESLSITRNNLLQAPIYLPYTDVPEHLIYVWINPLYLEPNTQRDIRREFKEKSEIQLSDFLTSRMYGKLSEALSSCNSFKWTGPPFVKNYEVAERCNYSPVIKGFLRIMESEAMFLIMSQLTGLELHRLGVDASDSESEKTSSDSEEEAEACCSSEIGSSSKEEEGKISDAGIKNENVLTTASTSKDLPQAGVRKAKKKRKNMGNLKNDHGFGLGGLMHGWESDPNHEELESIRYKRMNLNEGDSISDVTSEVRRWSWGSYSLMRDNDLAINRQCILDTMFFSKIPKDWNPEYGGSVVYVAAEEEDELLTVTPSSNTLALVYRDEQTLHFTKHLNVRLKDNCKTDSAYHEVYCGYREIKR